MKEILVLKNIRTMFAGLNTNYDPTCFDKNIHIRLTNYESGDVIAGFEDKLTFVLEYLLHLFIKSFTSYNVDFSIKDESDATKKYIFSKYTNEFKQSNEYIILKNELYQLINFDDIVIKPLYSKKQETTKKSQFGNILDVVDVNILGDTIISLSQVFSSSDSINKFIFDDSISLLLSETNSSDKLNEKYLNKNARKIAKQIEKSNGYQENKLW